MTTQTTQTDTVIAKDVFLPREQFLAVLAEFADKLRVSDLAGWTKIEAEKGNRVFLPRTKTVRRIDIAGFDVDHSIGQVPHCGAFGTVKFQMRLHGTGDEQLARFRKLIALMVSLPSSKVPKAKAPKTDAPTETKPVVDPAEAAAKLAEEKAKRAALIAKVAAEKGVAVSPKALASESK